MAYIFNPLFFNQMHFEMWPLWFRKLLMASPYFCERLEANFFDSGSGFFNIP